MLSVIRDALTPILHHPKDMNLKYFADSQNTNEIISLSTQQFLTHHC